MRARQWMLVAALGLTLAATWWAARLEDDGTGNVAAVAEPVSRSPRTAVAARSPRAAAPAASAELAILREPWPAAGATLLQPPVTQAHMQAAPTMVAPVVPPLPFTFIGSIERGGRRTAMLMEGDQLHLVGARERIGEHYRVERVTPTQIEFTYLPMQQRQVLDTGQD